MFRELGSMAESLYKKYRRRGVKRAVLALLSVAVAVITVWSLLMPAFSMQKKYFCGCEEHVHTDECYVEYLSCGREEDGTHRHTAECYTRVPVCGKTEHEHSIACYSDPSAVETEETWKQSLPIFTGETAKKRIIKVASSQLGYRESSVNYHVAEDGSLKGYTRYGDWDGDPYEDWSGSFVSFCLNYAQVDREWFPYSSRPAFFKQLLETVGRFAYPTDEDFKPDTSDILFIGGEEAERLAIVEKVDAEKNSISCIEGDRNGAVERRVYSFDDPNILGCGFLPDEMPSVVFSESVAGLTVTVSAPENAFPEDSYMEIAYVDEEDIISTVNEAVSGNITGIQAVDIKFCDVAGNEIEPLVPVHVTLKSDRIASDPNEPSVVHIGENGSAELVALSVDSYQVPDELSFDAESFSTYAITYTVEYGTDAFTQQMAGGSAMLLSQLFGYVNINENVQDVASVTSSAPSVISAEYVTEDVTISTDLVLHVNGSDWLLTSLAPITTDHETITVVMNNGNTYTIKVSNARDITNLQLLLTYYAIIIDGSPVTQGQTAYVDKDFTYNLVLRFEETAGMQFDNYADLIYELPAGVILPDGYHSTFDIPLGRPGVLCNNTVDYVQEPGGRRYIVVRWNHGDDLTDEGRADRDLFNFFTSSASAQITLNLLARLDPDVGVLLFEVDKGINVVELDRHNAIVYKTGEYDMLNNRINYTVVVESDGTTSDIVLMDYPGTAISYNNDVSIDWARSHWGVAVDSGFVWDGDVYEPLTPGADFVEYKHSTVLITNEGGTFRVHIPQMVDENYIAFKYSSNVNYDGIAQSSNATFEETGNTAQITGDEITTDNTSVYQEQNIEFSDLEKDCTRVSKFTRDGRQYYRLTWEINTNDKCTVSIADTDVSDHIGLEVRDICRYTGTGVMIKVYRGGTLIDTRNVSWAELGINTATADSWTYHIPDTDVGVLSYVFTYDTEVPVSEITKDTFITNYAEGRGGTDVAMEILHPPGSEGIGVSKKALGYTSDTVDWKIDITVQGNAGYETKLTFMECYAYNEVITNWKDQVRRGLPRVKVGNEYFKEFLTDPENDITVSGLIGEETYKIEYSHRSNASGPDYLEIYFYKSADQSESNRGINIPEGGVSESRTISITLHAHYDARWPYAVNEVWGSTNTWYYKHINLAIAGEGQYNGSVPVRSAMAVDTVAPRGRQVHKALLRSYFDVNNRQWEIGFYEDNPAAGDPVYDYNGTNIIGYGGYVLPTFTFQVLISNVETDDPIIIEDKFDKDIFEFYEAPPNSYYVYYNDPLRRKNKYDWRYSYFGVMDNYNWIATANCAEIWRLGQHDCYVEETADGVRFHMGYIPKRPNGTYYNFYGVYYWLRPKSLEALKELERRALSPDEINYLDPKATKPVDVIWLDNTATSLYGSATARIKYPASEDFMPVRKTMERHSNNAQDRIINCCIDVNKGRLKLNDGYDMIVTDTYSDSLSIDFNTIRVTTYPEGAPVSYDFSHNVGTFIVPDETYVKITYQAVAVGTEEHPNEFEVWNKAKIMSYDDEARLDLHFESQGGSIAENAYVYIKKYCASHMEIGLNGVTFQLFEAVDDGNGGVTFQPYHNKHTGEEVFYTTGRVDGTDGVVKIWLDATVDQDNLEFNKLYGLREVAPLPGYQVNNTMYRFTIVRGTLPDYSQYHYIQGDILTIKNSPLSTSIIIKKAFSGNYTLTDEQKNMLLFSVRNADGTAIQMQVTDENGDLVLDGNGDPVTTDDPHFLNIPYSNFTDGRFTLDKLVAGNYKVVESVRTDGEGHSLLVLPDDIIQSTSFFWDDMSRTAEFTLTEDDIRYGVIKDVLITNTYDKEYVPLLEAVKVWQDPSGGRINWPDGVSVVIDLCKHKEGEADVLVRSLTLDGIPDADQSGDCEARAGTASFKNLDVLRGGWEYVAKERAPVPGHDLVYTDGSFSRFTLVEGKQRATVINRQVATSISVSKTWRNPDGTTTAPTGANVKFRLYYYVTAETDPVIRPVVGKGEITLDGTVDEGTPASGELAAWVATFGELPTVNSSGQPITYVVVESQSANGYQAEYPSGREYARNGETILNRPESQDFMFQKQWVSSSGGGWPDGKTITVTIRRRLVYYDGENNRVVVEEEDSPLEAVYTLTDTSYVLKEGSSPPKAWDNTTDVTPVWPQSSFKFTLADLPKAGTLAGHEGIWEYYVTEKPESAYTTVYKYHGEEVDTGNVPSGGLIVNTLDEGPHYELPETGGEGAAIYFLGGAAVMTVSAAFLIKGALRRKKKGGLPPRGSP